MHFTDSSYFNAHKNHTEQISLLSAFLEGANQCKHRSSGLCTAPKSWVVESPARRISHYQPVRAVRQRGVLNYYTPQTHIGGKDSETAEWKGREKFMGEVKLEEGSNFKDKIRKK